MSSSFVLSAPSIHAGFAAEVALTTNHYGLGAEVTLGYQDD